MTGRPLRYAFAAHVHQPVGNFSHIFEDHVRDVYLPFLTHMAESELLPISLHVSGPIFEWLEEDGSIGHEYLDLIGRLVADHRLELLAGGFYEPVLVSLPPEDRAEQILWMREYLERRFGYQAQGLWLTERVWEPCLAADLAEAGMSFALVDDRHFLVNGFERDRLHAPYRTEADGRPIALFPIDEKLRYMIPFRPPREIVDYLAGLRTDGQPMAVFGDDGEKFGGWPGTRRWVYGKDWLGRYTRALAGMVQDGELMPTTFAEALREVPSAGLAYLPSASYREMEGWSLFPVATRRLARLERDLGEERMSGPDGRLVRGGHWRNFLAKYPESNRMHKKMLALSRLCRERGDPPEARRAIARAQCNDPYWHGVFGGLYLPHLRHATWRNLALAERDLRAGEELTFEVVDFDADGHPEIWIHSSAFSAIVSPAHGGVVEEHTLFNLGVNCVDVLTRRREAYHIVEPPGEAGADSQDVEDALLLSTLPPVDAEARALFVDRVLPGDLTRRQYAGGAYEPVFSWAATAAHVDARSAQEHVTLVMRLEADDDSGMWLEKEMEFQRQGGVVVTYRWDPDAFPSFSFFAPELSVAHDVELQCEPEAEIWKYPITTVGRSETGLEETVQGISVTPRWSTSLGEARVRPLLPCKL
jgi:alpha-amylase